MSTKSEKAWRELPEKWKRDVAQTLQFELARIKRTRGCCESWKLSTATVDQRITAHEAAIAALEELAPSPDEPPSR